MKSNNSKPSICFVAHFAYGTLCGGNTGSIGGAERQTSLLAKWFAEQGYDVSMITWDEDQEDGVVIDGVRVYKTCRRHAGLPGVRFIHPRWTRLVRAMKKAHADVYYQSCAEYVTGQVAMWCRRNNRRFIYSVASDPDCDPQLPQMKKIRERLLYRYGLQHADYVIVQTNAQQRKLYQGFGIDSEVIPIPCPDVVKKMDTSPPTQDAQPLRVLWIGRICRIKRPDRFLAIAEACPDLAFDLVGPSDGSSYAKECCDRAKRLANVAVHGSVLRHQVLDFYRRAACLCCTSDFEGFPNTFIEACSYGVPIISTIDPDKFIVKEGLGGVGREIPELLIELRQLLSSPQRRQQAGSRARNYYFQTHSFEQVMPRFEKIFCRVAGFENGHRDKCFKKGG